MDALIARRFFVKTYTAILRSAATATAPYRRYEEYHPHLWLTPEIADRRSVWFARALPPCFPLVTSPVSEEPRLRNIIRTREPLWIHGWRKSPTTRWTRVSSVVPSGAKWFDWLRKPLGLYQALYAQHCDNRRVIFLVLLRTTMWTHGLVRGRPDLKCETRPSLFAGKAHPSANSRSGVANFLVVHATESCLGMCFGHNIAGVSSVNYFPSLILWHIAEKIYIVQGSIGCWASFWLQSSQNPMNFR